MARKPFLYDDQRITVAQSLLAVSEDTQIKSDETVQEIENELKTSADSLKVWQAYEKQLSQMDEMDEILDACFQGLEHAILAVERKAVVKRDPNLREQALTVYKALFPNGLSSLIHIPYKAEAAETQSFLRRAEEAKVANFLREHGLEEWTNEMTASLVDFKQTLESSSLSEEERKKLAEGVGTARKQFDRGLLRLLNYLEAKFPEGHPHAGWRKQKVEEPVEHAATAARTIQKQRASERKPANPSPPNSSTKIAWEK